MPSCRHVPDGALMGPEITKLLEDRALRILLAPQACCAVGQVDVELLGTLNNRLALHCRYVVCNLTSIAPVVHEQQLQVLHVGHQELLEAVGADVTRLGV
uniref:Uncharacterized protein n=1 Tax=Chlamydomonas euryale TaxID=1486919 RepID=A0A7R9YUU8_9CHLO